MLRHMENSMKQSLFRAKKKKGGKIDSEFWRASCTIAPTSIHYQNLKYQLRRQMAQEVVDEADNRHRKKQQKMQLTESNEADDRQEEDGIDNQDDHNNIGDGDEDNDDDIWNSWKTLLKIPPESIALTSLM
ncbi:hypothetical protein K501DRAFT_240825 [Backusella circina FSU 941]|nr:hypothetical protein K501DRAFT_240825 [Backusella circina FSU 941]